MLKIKADRKKYYLIYSGLFIIMALLVFFCFFKNGYSFVWQPDGFSYYSGLKALRQVGFSFSGFSFAYGMGNGFRELVPILALFNPLRLLAVIWPLDNLEAVYFIIVIFGYYVSGITFSALARKFNRSFIPVLLGAFMYTFSGYMVFNGIRQIYFGEIMVAMFPLIILGIEKILRNERLYLLVISVFILSLESLYYLYVCSVLAVVYFFVRFFTMEVKRPVHKARLIFTGTGRIILAYAAGALMGFVGWINNFQTYSGNGRVGKSVLYNLAVYELSYYRQYIQHLFSGTAGGRFGLCLSFSSVAFPALLILFFRFKDRKNRTLIWIWIAGTLGLFIPAFGYICSGFSYLSDRWCFGYAAIMAMIVVMLMESLSDISKKQIMISVLCLLIYAVVCIIPGSGLYIYLGLGMIALTLTAVIFLVRFKSGKYRKYMMQVLFVIGCLSIVVNANMAYSRYGDDYQIQFVPAGKVDSTLKGFSFEGLSEYLNKNEDPTFFRVAADDVTNNTTLGALSYNLYGVSDFKSSEPSYADYLIENDNAGVQDITAKDGMDSRTQMMELAAVKYYSADADTLYPVPYGYELADELTTESGTYDIYKNLNELPFGYSYSSYITREEYEKLDVVDRQTALMQAVLLEKDTDDLPHENSIATSSVYNEVLSVEYDGVLMGDGNLTVTKSGGSIKYTIEPLTGELYVHIKGLHLTDSNARWYVNADTDISHDMTYYFGDYYTYYATPDKLLNLGYSEHHGTEVTVSFTREGTYTIDSINIITLQMNDYDAQVEALRSGSLTDAVYENDTITGKAEITEKSIMCFPVPYSTAAGWTAYVDGVKTEILRANTMYMGIILEPGIHDIRMEYHSPGFIAAVIISSASTGLFIVFLIYFELKRKKKNTVEKDSIS